MKIKKEILSVDAVEYCVEIEYDNKIFYASAYYWLNAQEISDWNIDSNDCDFDKLPIETQNKLMSFVFDAWANSDIFLDANVYGTLNTIKH